MKQSTNDGDTIVGINWGSSNFRAFHIGADGNLLDSIEQPSGIASLTREQMVALVAEVATRWPEAQRIYACGMVGSNIGWSDAGYVMCPVAPDGLASALHDVRIGEVTVSIVPGLACRRSADGAPDIMRGEETELFGLLASHRLPSRGVVALPGTHTKWVRMEHGRVAEFMTAMSGEIFDRLTAAGLLASIVDGPAGAGEAFRDGVRNGYSGALGLGTLLFGARAKVIRGELARADGASYLRGMLIGAEIADAIALFPEAAHATVPLVGSGPVCALYAEALAIVGLAGQGVDARGASVDGFHALHAKALA